MKSKKYELLSDIIWLVTWLAVMAAVTKYLTGSFFSTWELFVVGFGALIVWLRWMRRREK